MTFVIKVWGHFSEKWVIARGLELALAAIDRGVGRKPLISAENQAINVF